MKLLVLPFTIELFLYFTTTLFIIMALYHPYDSWLTRLIPKQDDIHNLLISPFAIMLLLLVFCIFSFRPSLVLLVL